MTVVQQLPEYTTVQTPTSQNVYFNSSTSSISPSSSIQSNGSRGMTTLSLIYFITRQSYLCCKIKSPAINIVTTSQQHRHHQTTANHSKQIQPPRFEGPSMPCLRNIGISTTYANLLARSRLNYLLETFAHCWSELSGQIYCKNKLRRS